MASSGEIKPDYSVDLRAGLHNDDVCSLFLKSAECDSTLNKIYSRLTTNGLAFAISNCL